MFYSRSFSSKTGAGHVISRILRDVWMHPVPSHRIERIGTWCLHVLPKYHSSIPTLATTTPRLLELSRCIHVGNSPIRAKNRTSITGIISGPRGSLVSPNRRAMQVRNPGENVWFSYAYGRLSRVLNVPNFMCNMEISHGLWIPNGHDSRKIHIMSKHTGRKRHKTNGNVGIRFCTH